MAARNIGSTGIVLEALRKGNYRNWSTLVRNYLVGQDLWYGIIEPSPLLPEDGSDGWISRNAKALHAIQLACGSENLSSIREFETAEEAWNHLWMLFSEDANDYYYSEEQGPENKLHIDVSKGKWEEAKAYITKFGDDALLSVTPYTGRTVLHIAVASGRDNIVKELVDMNKPELFGIQDLWGYTALALAAELADNKTMAECMIGKGGTSMLSIKTNNYGNYKEEIPVLIAAAKGHKQMTRYLFSLTPLECLFKDPGNAAGVLFTRCISAEIFDVAAILLQQPMELCLPSNNVVDGKELQSIKALADMPYVFRSGTKLGWWTRFIYYSLRIPTTIAVDGNLIVIVLHDEPEEERNTNTWENLPTIHPFLDRFLRAASVLVPAKLLQQLPGSEEIYQMKLNHCLVLEILEWLSITASRFDAPRLDMYSVNDSMLQAVKYGITEFINSMICANPDLLRAEDDNGKGLFSYAIRYRQENVFPLILGIQEKKQMIASHKDFFGNNFLHHAAELGPCSYLSQLSNPALQMQRELQWFKAVEKFVPHSYKEAKNDDGMTPLELFAKNHEDLMKAGELWARDTASSFTVVGTLIITIMFAAALTVPGGNDQNTGIPIFLKRGRFQVFIIADTISLIMSSSSVLIFSEILTSRYAMKDFLMSLHLKILLGLFTLFFSVTSMMVTFVAALSMMLKEHQRVVIAAISLSIIPVLVFSRKLLSLTYEVFKCTWIWPNTVSSCFQE